MATNEEHTRCSTCGGELDAEGWCPNYCTVDDCAHDRRIVDALREKLEAAKTIDEAAILGEASKLAMTPRWDGDGMICEEG